MARRRRGGAVSAALLALALCLPAASAAQEPPPATPAQAPAPATSAPAGTDYRIGPGDVLEITVFDNVDLSRTPTVQTSGVIALPLLGEVAVAGLTPPEVRQKLTTLLARDYLVNPQVEVKVKEYQSQFVSVVGEVNSPGRKPLRGRTRLIDVLIEAGSFTPRASGEVVITRLQGSFEGGVKTLRLRLGGGPLTPQDQISLEVVLQDGDLITASAKYYVTVEGEVAHPNRYPIDGDLTVTGAISLAGGLSRFGGNNVKVRRLDPETGKISILEVDLKAVRSGKATDPPLLANDVITVPRRRF